MSNNSQDDIQYIGSIACKRRRPSTASFSADSSWNCPTCTSTVESIDEACLACNFVNEQIDKGSWSCTICTLINSRDLNECAACGNALEVRRMNLKSECTRQQIEASLSPQKGNCASCLRQDSSSFQGCRACDRGNFKLKVENGNKSTTLKTRTISSAESVELRRSDFQLQVVSPYKISEVIYSSHIERNEVKLVETASIIDLAFSSLDIPLTNNTSLLHWSTCRFVTLFHQTSNWDCGYRNIQQLSWCLLNYASPKVKSLLFHGLRAIPAIRDLQLWIETAWKDGFDPTGSLHFNSKLQGQTKWIGATEVACLFRYFGIRASIIDFKGGKKKPHHKMVAFVWSYFSKNEDSRFSHILLPKNASRYPLYLQYQGHSELIVGVEKDKNGRIYLYSLDPANIQNKLSRKSQHNFKQREYQLVYLNELGTNGLEMSPDERCQSKDLSKTNLYLVES